MKPRLLDLGCNAGGLTAGYQKAGFYVEGVDIVAQPRYCGSEFHQADMLTFPLEGFDAVHVSPPCQRWSRMSACRPGLADTYPDLIAPMRERLVTSGLPYVIENVPGSPLIEPMLLCGSMFGLGTYRHRLFESNVPLHAPDHPKHVIPTSRAGHWKPGTMMSISGHVAPWSVAKQAMGIDWMSRDELVEAVPPAMGLCVGEQLLAALR